MAVTIKVNQITIDQAGMPIAGGGRSAGIATVTVTLSGEHGDLPLTLHHQFTSLDDLISDVRREIRKFAEELTQASSQPLL